MNATRLICAILAFGAVSVAKGQPATNVAGVSAILAGLPSELLSAAKLQTSDPTVVTYFPRRLGADPMTGVVSTPIKDIASLDALRGSAREAFHEAGIRKVIAEGVFTTPSLPGATGVYGEYSTGSGFKQSWLIEHGGNRIASITTMFASSPAENARVRAEIGSKVFGGASVTLSEETVKP